MAQAPENTAKVAKQQFRDAVVSHLNQVAPVTARGMFGGYGLYLEGIMFALIACETVYFKVDDGNRADFEGLGMSPFTYVGKGKPIKMSYYEIPSSVWQDLPTLAHWVDQAHAAARRVKRGKSRSR
ncbi:MAG: TfoX/Sxy family protein [Leptolyngbya sp. SIOISBB]|nr:TfoX/Sxy family protein [Leptolyngbya sp. SIOISBB]